jgi:hypothetical protein
MKHRLAHLLHVFPDFSRSPLGKHVIRLNRDSGMPPGIPNLVLSQFGASGSCERGRGLGQEGPKTQDPEPSARSSQLALALALANSGGSGFVSQSVGGIWQASLGRDGGELNKGVPCGGTWSPDFSCFCNVCFF